MIPRKRHLVATLFYGDLVEENLTLPKDREWKPIHEIEQDVKGPIALVWGKDDKGNVNQIFYFNKYPHWYYAHVAELAGPITHYILIGGPGVEEK